MLEIISPEYLLTQCYASNRAENEQVLFLNQEDERI